jgi:outer membrane biogenesis lipoprotein LolB
LRSGQAHNADLEPTKGLMRIEIISGGRITSGRAAWAAEHPDRLRLEWLSALGQPLMSMAGDGKTITLYSSADQTYRRFAQSRTALERLIRIPIGIEDLIDVLAGRPPCRITPPRALHRDRGSVSSWRAAGTFCWPNCNPMRPGASIR